LLQDPHIARACICEGGILWRVALQYADLDVVFSCPTDDAVKFGIGERFDWGGTTLWTDSLEFEEKATLLGVFIVRNYVHTDAACAALMSLWPQHHSWADSSLDSINWTPTNESWFQSRKQAYLTPDLAQPAQSKAQPKSGAEWAKSIDNHNRPMRRVWIASRHQAALFLEHYTEELR
jgi:hypothetical protein